MKEAEAKKENEARKMRASRRMEEELAKQREEEEMARQREEEEMARQRQEESLRMEAEAKKEAEARYVSMSMNCSICGDNCILKCIHKAMSSGINHLDRIFIAMSDFATQFQIFFD